MRATVGGPATPTLSTADKCITSILGHTALHGIVDDHEGDNDTDGTWYVGCFIKQVKVSSTELFIKSNVPQCLPGDTGECIWRGCFQCLCRICAIVHPHRVAMCECPHRCCVGVTQKHQQCKWQCCNEVELQMVSFEIGSSFKELVKKNLHFCWCVEDYMLHSKLCGVNWIIFGCCNMFFVGGS